MNNYCLRRLRYALKLNDKQILDIFSKVNFKLTPVELQSYLLKEDDKKFVPLPDYILTIFLDGLIQYKRGKREGEKELEQAERVALSKKEKLNNNIIVNKIKIALSLKADDLIAILALADFRISKAETSAFFRKSDHRNYRECGNQFLRNMLTGLTLKYRSKNEPD
jgi:uncharacterized protein YehS (DUF1456 family)